MSCFARCVVVVAVVCLAGCGPREAPKPASRPASAPDREVRREETLRKSAFTLEAMQRCAKFPTLKATSSCGDLTKDAGPPLELCIQFATVDRPKDPVMLLMLSRQRVDLLTMLGMPPHASILAEIPAGPERDHMATYLKERERAELVEVRPGRRVELRNVGIMMGGVISWGTLKSQRGELEMLLQVSRPLHDYPSEADWAALRAVDIPKTLDCLAAEAER